MLQRGQQNTKGTDSQAREVQRVQKDKPEMRPELPGIEFCGTSGLNNARSRQQVTTKLTQAWIMQGHDLQDIARPQATLRPKYVQNYFFAVVPCQAPPYPDHGFWTWDAVNNGTISYQCLPGFTLEGYNSSTCYNGQWQRQDPICRGMLLPSWFCSDELSL